MSKSWALPKTHCLVGQPAYDSRGGLWPPDADPAALLGSVIAAGGVTTGPVACGHLAGPKLYRF